MTLCDQLHMNWLVSEIDFNSFIHSSMSVLLSCLSVNWSLLIDWLIWLEREERWKERMEEEEMTLDWHWLIENRVCSRNESWLVWLISFHWLIDEIDWWIEREQTTNFESNNDWLIDWQKRHIEDGWVGKEKFDWFNEMKWMNEYHWLIWFYLFVRLNWLRWMRKLWMLCDCPLASLIWFLFCWLIDSFHLSLIDWFVCSWEWIELNWLIDWEKKRKLTNGNWNKQANDNEKDCWLICLLSQSIEIHHHHQTWLIEWMENWIDFNKQNKSSINSGGWLLKQQTNKQTTHSQWLIDWLIGNWKKVRHKNEIDFISLFTCFLWFGWLVDLWVDWIWDWLIWWWFSNLTFSFFLSFTHLTDWHLIKDWLFDVRWNQLSIVKDWWK